MALRVRTAVPLTLAVGALFMMVVAELASAGHVRPKSASTIKVAMVPAFQACSTPNRTHGPPLAVASCAPPVQTSSAITIGEPSNNGAAANSEGWVKLAVKAGIPGGVEDSDVLITASGTDIRCRPGATACGSTNAAAGADYTGELEGNATIRISDHYNGISTGGGSDPATMIDIPFPVVTGCAATASTAIGSTCTADTSANATVAGSVKDGKRAIVEIGQLRISDGGLDGLATTGPNTLFSVQGLFIP